MAYKPLQANAPVGTVVRETAAFRRSLGMVGGRIDGVIRGWRHGRALVQWHDRRRAIALVHPGNLEVCPVPLVPGMEPTGLSPEDTAAARAALLAADTVAGFPSEKMALSLSVGNVTAYGSGAIWRGDTLLAIVAL